jgi:hypothetical protein
MTIQKLGHPDAFQPEPDFQYYRIVRYFPKEQLKKKKSAPRKAKTERKWFWQPWNQPETETPEIPHSWSSVTILYLDKQVLSRPQFTKLMSADEMATVINQLVEDGYEQIALYEGKKKQVLIFGRAFQSHPTDMIPAYELDASLKRMILPGGFEAIDGQEYCELERVYPGEGLNWSGINETYFDPEHRGKTKRLLTMTPEGMNHKIEQIRQEGYQLVVLAREAVRGVGFRESLFFGRDYIGNPHNIDDAQPAQPRSKPVTTTPFPLEPGWDYCRITGEMQRGDFYGGADYFDAAAYQRQEFIGNPGEIQNLETRLAADGWQKVESDFTHQSSMTQSGVSYYRRAK